VSRRQETPFDSIESAQEYLRLLAEEVAVVLNDVEADAISAARPRSTRRIDALRLVLYKLQKLQQHVHASRRILNDLRTLRRLLAGERSAVAVSTSPVEVFSDEEPEPPGV
jgi:uncharacterized membrane protein YccC